MAGVCAPMLPRAQAHAHVRHASLRSLRARRCAMELSNATAAAGSTASVLDPAGERTCVMHCVVQCMILCVCCTACT